MRPDASKTTSCFCFYSLTSCRNNTCKDSGFFPLMDTQKRYIYILGGGFKYFYVHPYLGKTPILTNIFQRGWNHQLVYIYIYIFVFCWAKVQQFVRSTIRYRLCELNSCRNESKERFEPRFSWEMGSEVGTELLVFNNFYSKWMFPKIGGFYPPKWMIKMMEKPIKMDDLGVALFLETSI